MNTLNLVLKSDHIQAEFEDEIGMEGFFSFTDFLSGMGDSIRQAFKKLVNEDIKALDVGPVNLSNVTRKYDKHDFAALSEINAYRPDDLIAPMVDYSAALVEQLEAMANIQERLYIPVIKWLAKAATREDFHKQAWVDKDLKLNDLERMTKVITPMFDKRRERDANPEVTPVPKQYGSMRQMNKAHDNLQRAFNLGSDFDLESLKKTEESLIEHIGFFVKMIEDSENPIDVPKATKRNLAKVIRNIATETEYYVGIVFMTRVAITAFNDTVEVLEES